MTIVAGFLSQDGWVLASDSLETVSDYSKNTTDKIKHLNISPQWRLVFAAAGHGAYADMLQANMEKACEQEPSFDFDVAQKIISAEVLSIHRDHIWPRPAQDRPSMEALILVQQTKPGQNASVYESMRLFATSDTAVFPVDSYRAIGVGAHMADYLYGFCFWLIMRAETVERSAIYMLDQIRNSIVGCDGESIVAAFLTDGSFRYTKTREVKQIEQAFIELDQAFKTIFKGIADPHYQEAQFLQDLEKCKPIILGAREKQIELQTERQREWERISASRAKHNKPKN